MGRTKIVNLIGGPGSGKSTTAAGLFFELKTAEYTCELVHEWIKDKVYEGSEYVKTNQGYVYEKQRKLIHQTAQNVPLIVTDSPTLLSLIYGDDALRTPLILRDFHAYENICIVINRVKKYNPVGRYQDELGAIAIDNRIREMLHENKIPYYVVDGDRHAPLKILQILQELHIDSPEEELNNWKAQ